MKFILILMTLGVIATQASPPDQQLQLKKIEIELEMVTDNAVTGGDSGNQWGGHQCRIFKDWNERYYILDDSGILYLLPDNSYTAIDSVQIELQEYEVNYSGFGLSIPRTGAKLSNTIHVIYPSVDGKYYVYFC